MPNFFQDRFPVEEAAAIHKQPRAGKCPQSEFGLGWHRVGLVPYYSVLDGGAPGDSCRWMCLSCGRLWDKEPGAFVLRQQPRRIGEPQP